jgi:uncharacterized protein (DUF1499 family)
MSRSFAAVASARVGLLALLLVAAGAGGAARGWLAPMTAFGLFGIGLVPLGALTLLLGLVGLLRTRAVSGRAGRGQAVLGTGLGAGLVALLVVASWPGRGLPRINDITTDPQDPPRFEVAARELEASLAYPGESFAAQQRAAYPDLAPLELELPPARALERAEAAAREIGLDVVAVDRAAGTLEARETSTVFHFVDDVAVRVTPSGSGSRVDVRSRSRDGRGDLGVNARRIRRLFDAMR